MERNKILLSMVIVIAILYCQGCRDNEPLDEEPFVKELHTYKSVVIGNQEWMAEDLKNNTFCNDEPIREVQDTEEWIALKKPGWSFVENDKEKNGSLGKLYNWYAVSDPRNICPCGWHVPSWDDMMELIAHFGGAEKAGGAMKATGTIQIGDGLWYEPNTGATNSSGFSGIPTGARYSDGFFAFTAYGAVWWTTNGNYLDADASVYQLIHTSEELIFGSSGKTNGFAVRCIKD